MTLRERKRMAVYLRSLANTIGLRDWTFNIQQDEPDTKEAYAAITCVYGRRIANVWFAHGFEHLDPVLKRHVILHELLHVHLWPITSLASETLEAAMGATAYAVYDEALTERIEHAVDAIADAFADAIPVPA